MGKDSESYYFSALHVMHYTLVTIIPYSKICGGVQILRKASFQSICGFIFTDVYTNRDAQYNYCAYFAGLYIACLKIGPLK